MGAERSLTCPPLWGSDFDWLSPCLEVLGSVLMARLSRATSGLFCKVTHGHEDKDNVYFLRFAFGWGYFCLNMP